jgi:hypothetical protein
VDIFQTCAGGVHTSKQVPAISCPLQFISKSYITYESTVKACSNQSATRWKSKPCSCVGTMLQAEGSWVRFSILLDFPIDLNFLSSIMTLGST